MNRRRAIFGMAAAAATLPVGIAADDAATWTAWWERSKKYTVAIAEAPLWTTAGTLVFARGITGMMEQSAT